MLEKCSYETWPQLWLKLLARHQLEVQGAESADRLDRDAKVKADTDDGRLAFARLNVGTFARLNV
jgi:hypothetical protein